MAGIEDTTLVIIQFQHVTFTLTRRRTPWRSMVLQMLLKQPIEEWYICIWFTRTRPHTCTCVYHYGHGQPSPELTLPNHPQDGASTMWRHIFFLPGGCSGQPSPHTKKTARVLERMCKLLKLITVYPRLSEHSIIWTLDYLNTALAWLRMRSSHVVHYIKFQRSVKNEGEV